MNLEVIPLTRDHIANGKVGDCCECPVALALHDAGHHPSTVQPEQINFGGDDEEGDDCKLYTSFGMLSWMLRFDDGGRCEPFAIVMTDTGISTLAEYQEAL